MMYSTIGECKPITRFRIIEALTTLRLEWEEATNGQSLLDTNGSVGLIIADLANMIGLTVPEQQFILGDQLFKELITQWSSHNR
jgi:hypothetical protein